MPRRNAFHAARRPATVLVCLALSLFSTPAQAQLRIVSYNTAGSARAGIETIFEAIGNESVNGITRPIDILAVQEQSNVSTTTEAVMDALNGLFAGDPYARGTVNGGTSGGGRPGIVYNTQTVELLSEVSFGTVNTSNQARQTLRYQFRPVGYGASADFYIYVNHYKSGDTGTDEARRQVEAVALRANADALGNGVHALYTGDFNMQSSTEDAYQTLLAAGNGQAFDPINRPGTWHDQNAFRDVHTQSPATTAAYGGQITGGMDDRFDFQLVTGELLDSEGMAYITGSYRAFGNNGTHSLNGAITTGTGAAPAVLTALATVSDHLPVVADYQLPARMSVSLAALPARVLAGASLSALVTVSNSAPVGTVNGADELDFTATGSDALSGNVVGTDDALGGGSEVSLAFDTASVGTRTGTVTVTSDSQGVADGSFTEEVQVDVLAHADASFSLLSDQNSLTLDFGAFAPGSGTQQLAFSLTNLVSPLGITAGLDLDQILASGDSARLTTDLAAFSSLAAGEDAAFLAFFDTVSAGTFEAVYTLSFTDEDLPGATTLAPLTLTLRRQVVGAAAAPEPGTLLLLAVVFLSGVGGKRRSR